MSQQEISAPADPAVRSPSPEAIAARAYEIFLARGGQHGRNLADWLEAERELMNGLEQRRDARNLPLGLRLLG